MNPAKYSLAANMVNQLNRVDVLSNNLANVNTNGFKEDNLVEGSFNHYLEKAQEKKLPTSKYSEVINTVPKIDGSYVSKTSGAIVETGNNLDFALKNPNNFFKIQDNLGNTLLTRDGSFKNMDGFLVTSEGNKVLDFNNQPILVNEQFQFNIAVTEADYRDIYKVGSNNYKFDDPTKVTDLDNNSDKFIQGSLEKSNINAVTTMVALIDAQRRLEQAQKASVGLSEVTEKLLSKIDGR